MRCDLRFCENHRARTDTPLGASRKVDRRIRPFPYIRISVNDNPPNLRSLYVHGHRVRDIFYVHAVRSRRSKGGDFCLPIVMGYPQTVSQRLSWGRNPLLVDCRFVSLCRIEQSLLVEEAGDLRHGERVAEVV
jgi:hypothetical protein